MTDEVCLPTFTVSLPLLRYIFIREGITVVHSHQATSAMANEAITYASELGLPSVYTDHSLFGFNDIASIILNRVLKVTMSTVGRVICVSYTCRDNFVLRAQVPQSIVHVIPNAVDTTKFTPQPSKRNNRITVVVVSRLVYRKGVDLLIGIIPRICNAFPNVDFLIGGDGNKKLELETMVHNECLEDRVTFLGFVPHSSVRDVLVHGHVFLNCSLTESFCIAILEAASSGLLVVSTNVGGVPEVLPPDMITLADPNVEALVMGLSMVLSSEKINTVDPHELHERIKAMYSWERVAKETIMVYDELLLEPRLSFLQRLARYKTVGGIAGYVVCLLSITQHFLLRLVEWWQPQDIIDVVPDITCCETKKISEKEQVIIDSEKSLKLKGN
jgi:phosphatidylinositol glycan class A protein